MKETGLRNSAHGADKFGFKDLAAVHWNLTAPSLYEHALANHEAQLVEGGALCAETGIHTGRSPKDKFVVCDEHTEKTIWWEKNGKLTPAQFDLLHQDFLDYAQGRQLYVQDLYGGADPKYRIKARVFTELAWHSLFIRTLLIRPDRGELSHYVPDFTILCLPSFKADPNRHGVRSETVVAINFTKRIILIGGSYYAGEMKKSVFTTLNYYLPAESVMPMHCSANVGPAGDAAVFFGLSGTGKTTLSADPNRTLIGDDEHGWGPQGVFNFEGGCYAKCIKLSREAEPEIYAATLRFGTILENVVFDPETRVCDFDNDSKTENTRSAYPLDYIPNASPTGRAGMPKNIVFLTADAYGVMPPIAKLTPAQAMYHFLSGYTAKVAGTEKGLVGVEPEFSTCFGAPFLPRHPSVYGNLLRELIGAHGVDCWLGQHRLDWRQIRRRPPHAHQGDAHAAHRRARRLAAQRQIPHRPVFRLCGADPARRCRAAFALSAQDLAEQGRVRRHRPRPGRHVPEEFCSLREPRRRRCARGGAGGADRGGVSAREQ